MRSIVRSFRELFSRKNGEDLAGHTIENTLPVPGLPEQEQGVVASGPIVRGIEAALGGKQLRLAIVWEGEASVEGVRFSFVSRRAETLLGFPVERWLGEPDFWKHVLRPDDRDGAFGFYSKIIAIFRHGAATMWSRISPEVWRVGASMR